MPSFRHLVRREQTHVRYEIPLLKRPAVIYLRRVDAFRIGLNAISRRAVPNAGIETVEREV